VEQRCGQCPAGPKAESAGHVVAGSATAWPFLSFYPTLSAFLAPLISPSLVQQR
jgi:hypothetical protein